MRRVYLPAIAALVVFACDGDPAEPPAPDREDLPGVAAALIAPPACTKSWTSGIGGLWSDPSRWTPAGAPASSDDVCIAAAGTYDVTHTLPIDVHSLRIGAVGANVTFDFDSPQFGVGITTEDGIWIESGSRLNVLSVGGVPLAATSGNLTVAGRLDIENTCACGGDVATLEFLNIQNSGRMTLDAPITVGVTGTSWVNQPGSVIVTSGTGVINAGSHVFDASGSIAGSTAIEVGALVWRGGTIDTIAPVTSAVLVTGGWLSLIGDTQEGRIDAVTRNRDRVTVLGRTVSANITVEVMLLSNDSLEIAGGTATAPFLLDGVLAISSNGSNMIFHDELTNRGTISISGTGSVEFVGDELINEGDISTWGSDLSFTSSGSTFRNRGDIYSFPNPITLTMGPGTEFVAEGSGEVDGSVSLELNGATLSGDGRVGSVNSIGGSIEPGAPYGTLNMDYLTMDAASEMVIHVGGTSAGSYGRASVLLDITLGGTFRLVAPAGPLAGRCGDVITPIYHRGDVPAGAFSVWRGLNRGPRSGWRAQATPDSLMLAGHDPSALKLTVGKSALFTTEAGAGDTSSLCLGIQAPQSSVTVQPNVQNGQLAAVAAVTFDTATWRLPQTISVAAIDDATVEPLHTDTLAYSFVSADAAYNGPAVKITPVTITDNDGDTDLEIVLQNAPAAVTVGSVFEIVLRVTNHGPTLSTGARLIVDPQGATNVAFEQAFGATCSADAAGVLTCDVAGQAVGAQNTIAIVYRANAAGNVTFDATIVSEQPDSNVVNDSVIAAVVVN